MITPPNQAQYRHIMRYSHRSLVFVQHCKQVNPPPTGCALTPTLLLAMLTEECMRLEDSPPIALALYTPKN